MTFTHYKLKVSYISVCFPNRTNSNEKKKLSSLLVKKMGLIKNGKCS